MDAYTVFEQNLDEARFLIQLYDTFKTSTSRDIRQPFRQKLTSLLRPVTGTTYVNRSNSAQAYVAFAAEAGMSWRHLRHARIKTLLRMSLVQAVSAMDCYFHDEIEWRFGRILSTSFHKAPKKLLSTPLPTGRVKETIDSYTNTTVGLRRSFEAELRKVSIQGPKAIEEKLGIIGVTGFWGEAAELMSVSPDTLKSWLGKIANRRNNIVHEGDRERLANGRLSRDRDISRDDVDDDIHVIDCFVYALDSIIKRDAIA